MEIESNVSLRIDEGEGVLHSKEQQEHTRVRVDSQGESDQRINNNDNDEDEDDEDDENYNDAEVLVPDGDEDQQDSNVVPTAISTNIETNNSKKQNKTSNKWNSKEDETLKKSVREFGEKNWRKISSKIEGRSAIQCLHRWSKILKPGLVKGPWTQDEDERLVQWVEVHGALKWSHCSEVITGRSGKQCRERWFNNLNPNVKKGNWTSEEDKAIFQGFLEHGSSWSRIAKDLEGRTENSVKNRFYSTVRKLLSDMEKKGRLLNVNKESDIKIIVEESLGMRQQPIEGSSEVQLSDRFNLPVHVGFPLPTSNSTSIESLPNSTPIIHPQTLCEEEGSIINNNNNNNNNANSSSSSQSVAQVTSNTSTSSNRDEYSQSNCLYRLIMEGNLPIKKTTSMRDYSVYQKKKAKMRDKSASRKKRALEQLANPSGQEVNVSLPGQSNTTNLINNISAQINSRNFNKKTNINISNTSSTKLKKFKKNTDSFNLIENNQNDSDILAQKLIEEEEETKDKKKKQEELQMHRIKKQRNQLPHSDDRIPRNLKRTKSPQDIQLKFQKTISGIQSTKQLNKNQTNNRSNPKQQDQIEEDACNNESKKGDIDLMNPANQFVQQLQKQISQNKKTSNSKKQKSNQPDGEEREVESDENTSATNPTKVLTPKLMRFLSQSFAKLMMSMTEQIQHSKRSKKTSEKEKKKRSSSNTPLNHDSKNASVSSPLSSQQQQIKATTNSNKPKQKHENQKSENRNEKVVDPRIEQIKIKQEEIDSVFVQAQLNSQINNNQQSENKSNHSQIKENNQSLQQQQINIASSNKPRKESLKQLQHQQQKQLNPTNFEKSLVQSSLVPANVISIVQKKETMEQNNDTNNEKGSEDRIDFLINQLASLQNLLHTTKSELNKLESTIIDPQMHSQPNPIAACATTDMPSIVSNHQHRDSLTTQNQHDYNNQFTERYNQGFFSNLDLQQQQQQQQQQEEIRNQSIELIPKKEEDIEVKNEITGDVTESEKVVQPNPIAVSTETSTQAQVDTIQNTEVPTYETYQQQSLFIANSTGFPQMQLYSESNENAHTDEDNQLESQKQQQHHLIYFQNNYPLLQTIISSDGNLLLDLQKQNSFEGIFM